jgi:hypothetical protein
MALDTGRNISSLGLVGTSMHSGHAMHFGPLQHLPAGKQVCGAHRVVSPHVPGVLQVSPTSTSTDHSALPVGCWAHDRRDAGAALAEGGAAGRAAGFRSCMRQRGEAIYHLLREALARSRRPAPARHLVIAVQFDFVAARVYPPADGPCGGVKPACGRQAASTSNSTATHFVNADIHNAARDVLR